MKLCNEIGSDTGIIHVIGIKNNSDAGLTGEKMRRSMKKIVCILILICSVSMFVTGCSGKISQKKCRWNSHKNKIQKVQYHYKEHHILKNIQTM